MWQHDESDRKDAGIINQPLVAKYSDVHLFQLRKGLMIKGERRRNRSHTGELGTLVVNRWVVFQQIQIRDPTVKQ